ncbi:hypothetical protein ACUY3H_04415 [Corynebacterium ureicelerivorans]
MNTLRNKLATLLIGHTLPLQNEYTDLNADTIYPLTIGPGTIAIRNLDGDCDIYEATAIINQDTSLTICANGNIIAYHPPQSYEATAQL